jgi:hypothetical protein
MKTFFESTILVSFSMIDMISFFESSTSSKLTLCVTSPLKPRVLISNQEFEFIPPLIVTGLEGAFSNTNFVVSGNARFGWVNSYWKLSG